MMILEMFSKEMLRIRIAVCPGFSWDILVNIAMGRTISQSTSRDGVSLHGTVWLQVCSKAHLSL